jgi:7,8-dihydropterin-6-yl-methyl-4-(beta-D-ribofuranosyl)aminobenzene 5'-phosphate synthase
MIILVIVVAVIIVLLMVGFGLLTIRFYRNRKKAENAWSTYIPRKLSDIGGVKNLTITPLIDWYADKESLIGEPGVSWLVQADSNNILMDVGVNLAKEDPSPLLRNMKSLNIKLKDIQYLFISHLHMDHTGGLEAQKARTVMLSKGNVDLSHITVFVPTRMQHSSAKIRLIEQPEVLMKGVASEGPIERSIYGMGLTKEQALVVNVAGKGLVLIVGCGHQGIFRIFKRAEDVFQEPVYALVGGLHYPVTESRMKLFGLLVQKFVGTGKLPWQTVTRDEVKESIAFLMSKKLQFVSISAHDSCDWTLSEFRNAFKGSYKELRVGLPLVLTSELTMV